MCHSGLTPPPEVVYKEPEEELESFVLNQAKRSPLVPQHLPRSNISENSMLERPYDPRPSPYKWLQPFIVLAKIHLRHLLQLCFTCLAHQALLLLQVVLLGFLVARVPTTCSKLLYEVLVIGRSLCKWHSCENQ